MSRTTCADDAPLGRRHGLARARHVWKNLTAEDAPAVVPTASASSVGDDASPSPTPKAWWATSDDNVTDDELWDAFHFLQDAPSDVDEVRVPQQDRTWILSDVTWKENEKERRNASTSTVLYLPAHIRFHDRVPGLARARKNGGVAASRGHRPADKAATAAADVADVEKNHREISRSRRRCSTRRRALVHAQEATDRAERAATDASAAESMVRHTVEQLDSASAAYDIADTTAVAAAAALAAAKLANEFETSTQSVARIMDRDVQAWTNAVHSVFATHTRAVVNMTLRLERMLEVQEALYRAGYYLMMLTCMFLVLGMALTRTRHHHRDVPHSSSRDMLRVRVPRAKADDAHQTAALAV